MFDKILIANRGEIALRVIRACREMGIASVAVHSTADADAMHVRMADESICIGPASSTDSYLNPAAIISACEITGAQAIHPGYGFMSENARFVQMVEDHGLTFIGPSAQHIRVMGDKITAKDTMKELGVPCVPGSEGGVPDVEAAKQIGRDFGYPVIIKATAGGGGRGMKVANSEAEMERAFQTARAEGKAAFGNDEVYIEKYLQRPRHIEIQVFGDGKGNAVHLGERDCSLQRRHQKVFEEAPGPCITEEERARIGAVCAKAVGDLKYSGAGTIEFLYEDGEFYFIEMNTRLQVEHPVTEAITGIDLVEWQLRVAAGEPLPMAQEELGITGHAFEARLYAEDVPAGFLPATGRLARLAFPPDVRADSGVRSGDVISPHYDPMISKLIVHGPTREIALRKLARGLAQTQVAGTVTNLAFLGALARHPGFARGEVDTGLIGRDIEALTEAPAAAAAMLAQAALSAAGLWEGDAPHRGFALWEPLARSVTLRHAGEEIVATLRVMAPDRIEVALGESRVLAERMGGAWRLDGRPAAALFHEDGEITVFAEGGQVFELVDPLERAAEASGGNLIEAPMPGRVVSVHAEAGQPVSAGDRLAVLEAMKMEHTLTAWRDGVVAEVLVTAGAQVEAGAALMRLEDEAEDAA